MTKDSFGGVNKFPQSLNRYAYTQGDPVDNTDPNGDILPILAAAIACGAAAAVYTYNNWGDLSLIGASTAFFRGATLGSLAGIAGEYIGGFLGGVATEGAGQGLLNAVTKADALKAIDNLPSNLQSGVKSFFKGGSTKYSEFTVEQTSNGNYLAKMTKPGDHYP